MFVWINDNGKITAISKVKPDEPYPEEFGKMVETDRWIISVDGEYRFDESAKKGNNNELI